MECKITHDYKIHAHLSTKEEERLRYLNLLIKKGVLPACRILAITRALACVIGHVKQGPRVVDSSIVASECAPG